MTVGAKDKIDRRLVQMYAKANTSNYDMTSAVDPEKMLSSMELMASYNKTFFNMKNNIGNRKSDLKDIA